MLAAMPDVAVVLVARRQALLSSLAESLGPCASFVAVDLLDDDAPAAVLAHVTDHFGRVDLLVNNAGAAWRSYFADGGYANVAQTMAINFDAQVRLTEALLPLLRASAPSAIVNVSSTAARVSRAGSGAYSASKAALAAWSEALWIEERPHRVHVGLVLPGFFSTEGFPQAELKRSARTRWMVSTPEKVAEAVMRAGFGGQAECYAPRPYGLAAMIRAVWPGAVRRAMSGSGAAAMNTVTRPDKPDA
jgi:short-subunit dehydrogenase